MFDGSGKHRERDPHLEASMYNPRHRQSLVFPRIASASLRVGIPEISSSFFRAIEDLYEAIAALAKPDAGCFST